MPAIAISAAVSVMALTAIQTDWMSRKYLLSSTQLQVKRWKDYHYRWRTFLELAYLQQQYYFAQGNIQTIQDDPDFVAKQTEYLSTETDWQEWLDRIQSATTTHTKVNAITTKSASPDRTVLSILRIDTDPDDPSKELYLYLMEHTPPDNDIGRHQQQQHDDHHPDYPRRLLQVPLIPFGLALQQTFEAQLTTTTFCFVADASSGKATQLIEGLVRETKSGVAIVSEPLWMIQLADIIHRQVIPMAKLEKIVFGLCRLEAWNVRHDISQETKTVLITLPGQATTSSILPILQTVFPEDRHVFAYDGMKSMMMNVSLLLRLHYKLRRSKRLP